MADKSNRAPRRRPVDVLFGEEVQLKPTASEPDSKQATPGYMVEPPRPVTTVRPPPPEFPSDWHVAAPPELVTAVEAPVVAVAPADADPIVPPPQPVMFEPVVQETIAEAVTFTVPPDSERRAPKVEPAPLYVAPPPAAPLPAPVPVSLYGQTELVELSQFVDQLYQNVADETSDSASLNAECLANLNAARVAIEKGEYSKAEASAEWVKARLLRARASRAAAAMPKTRLLYGGLILAALVGIVLFVIPFGFRFVPLIEPLLSGIGAGMLGGAAMALYQLSRHISRREYDAALNSKYALSPLFGALIGAVMYLLSLLGILAAPNALGLTFEPFALMYLFAFLGGIFNDVLIGGLRSFGTRQKI